MSIQGLSGTATAPAVDTLDHPAFLQLRFGHPANAICAKVCVPGLDATQAAQVLVSRLFPFRYQVGVGNLLSHTIIV